MAFLKTNKDTVTEDGSGILYILEMCVDGKDVYKIGVTKRKIEERVVEILTSHFHQYRHFCYCRPKRFRKTENVYSKETVMHRYFENYRFIPEKKFSGSTEFFVGLPLQVIVDTYEKCLNGEDILKDRYVC